MCPLQIITNIEPLTLTFHGVNACFIHHPSKSKNHSINHKSETTQPKKEEKKALLSYIFLHLCTNFWVRIQNNERYRNLALFEIWQIDT